MQVFGYLAALCKEAGKIARGLEYCAGAFRNLGKKSLEEVIEKLHSLGLDLKQEEE